MKKMLALLMALLIVGSLSGCGSFNIELPGLGDILGNQNHIHSYDENGQCIGCDRKVSVGLEYELSNDGTFYSVTGVGSCRDVHIVIPENYMGVTVARIEDNALRDIDWLENISIPDSIKTIGSNNFNGCPMLHYTVYDNARYLGNEENPYFALIEGIDEAASTCNIHTQTKITADGAFWGCEIVSITIPDGVTHLGVDSFRECPLEQVSLPNSIEYVCDFPKTVCTEYAGGYYLGNDSNPYLVLMEIDPDISYLVIHEDTKIAWVSSSNCDTITSITIGRSVTDFLWNGENNLESIQVENGNKKYKAKNNCLIDVSSKTLVLGTKNSIIPGDGSVEIIGARAFEDCKTLSEITIPNKIKRIESWAFSDCDSLTSIAIPNSVEYVGMGSFFACKSLRNVGIGSGVTKLNGSTFAYCEKLENIHLPSITSLSNEFYGCTSLKSIYVSDSLAEISSISSLDDCHALEFTEYDNGLYLGSVNNPYVVLMKVANENISSMSIHEDTRVVADSAFSGCGRLTNITIPDGVISIGYRAFSKCSNLTSINIPDGVTSIGYRAFYDCSNLTSITIPDGVTSIGDYAFYRCSSLTSINIPDSVTSIGEAAFYGCSLESITVEAANTVYHSDGNCLIKTSTKTLIAGCKNSIIPDDGSVTIISEWAFSDCSGLTSITIPDGVTSIGSGAFSYCSSLTSITIPDSVTSIGDTAFFGCSSLTSITIPDGVTSIGYRAFYDCSNLTSITIPDGVTGIGDSAFDGCWSLTSITIPDSVTSIGDSAFDGCSSLTSINIPDSVTSIGNNAFRYCNSLTSITVDENNTAYASQDGILYNKDKTQFVHIPQKIFGSVTIPNGITSIGNNAFHYCNSLTSITIPDGVTNIGELAFYDCSSLTGITFAGTMEQWKVIAKGRYWNESTGDYTIYCTDGEIKKGE